MDIREKLAKVARENIHLFEDAGCGMYNLDIDISGIYDKRESGEKYCTMGIFQIYPYETSEFYKSIFVLAYYPYNDKGDCENDCYEPCDEDLAEIYKRVKAELNGKYTMNKTESKLMPFIKATTLEEKVRIINAWEVDRGGESEECIYDLEDEEDRKLFENMYGVRAVAIRRMKNRFWMAGNAFYCDVAERGMNNSHEVYAVTLANIDKMFESIVSCIEDRAEEYLTSNMGDKAVTARDMALFYPFDIDFKGYFGLEQKFRWIACSTDGSFEDESKETFTSIEDAYLNMRNAVLEKMKWNTEFGDMEDCERLSVGYKLHFGTKEITHDSYSGFYIYRIVEAGREKENLIDLIKKAYSEGAKTINPSIPILTSTRSKSAVLKVNGFNEVFFDNGKEYSMSDLADYDLLLLYGDMVCHTEEQHLF